MAAGKTFDHATGRLISCGDAQIYVEERGNPDSPPLILLNGGFGSIDDFAGIAPALISRFCLIGIDSRAHGRSSAGDAELSYKVLEEDLAKVVDSLGLEKFSLLGLSDGGITALRYAARQDARLDKVVTVGASWEMSEKDPSWEMLSGMTGDIWKDMFPESHANYMRLNPEPDFGRFAAAIAGMWTDLSPDGYPEDSVRQIKVDCLVVRGDQDPLTSLASMAALGQRMENMNFLNIPFAEHVAYDDAPEMFLQAMDKFFAFPHKQNVSSASR